MNKTTMQLLDAALAPFLGADGDRRGRAVKAVAAELDDRGLEVRQRSWSSGDAELDAVVLAGRALGEAADAVLGLSVEERGRVVGLLEAKYGVTFASDEPEADAEPEPEPEPEPTPETEPEPEPTPEPTPETEPEPEPTR